MSVVASDPEGLVHVLRPMRYTSWCGLYFEDWSHEPISEQVPITCVRCLGMSALDKFKERETVFG